MIGDNTGYSRSGITGVVVHRDLGIVDEDTQPFAVVEQRVQRLCPTVLVRQAGQLRLGVREQAFDRLGELAPCRVEGPCLALEGGVVMLQPVVVQVVDERDPLDPFLAPFGQRHLAGRALDEVASLMCPASDRASPGKEDDMD